MADIIVAVKEEAAAVTEEAVVIAAAIVEVEVVSINPSPLVINFSNYQIVL
jgi:hypothetical protein